MPRPKIGAPSNPASVMLPPYIDELVYGVASKQDNENMQISNYLNPLLEKLYRYPFPANSSEQTKDELIILLRHSKARQITRKDLFDKSLIPFLNQLFIDNKADAEDVTTTTENIVNDILPLITKLKYYFNRPRPYQLLYYYKDIEFFPDYSYFVSSPSYPSGHAIMGLVAGNVLANHYPQSHQAMRDIMHEIKLSRLALGVHFPSDNEFAEIVVQAILQDRGFQRKYDL